MKKIIALLISFSIVSAGLLSLNAEAKMKKGRHLAKSGHSKGAHPKKKRKHHH
jgi:hypothetical protein